MTVKFTEKWRTAYDLKAEGYTWVEVAWKLGKTVDQVQDEAQQQAKENKLPWPIVKTKIQDAQESELVKIDSANRDNAQVALELRKQGKTWQEIANILHYSNRSTVYNIVHNYCNMRGLRMPRGPKSKRKSEKHRKAYRMREYGHTWVEIGKAIGMDKSSAAIYARMFAKAMNLAWPPVINPTMMKKLKRRGGNVKENYRDNFDNRKKKGG